MDALSIAASGIRSAEVRMSASAHNVANVATETVRPLRTTQVDQREGGSLAWSHQTPEPEPVDLAREAIEQIQASVQLRASARVFTTVAQTHGTLLDLFA